MKRSLCSGWLTFAFIVTWRATWYTPGACHHEPPPPDPYTGQRPILNSMTAEMCFDKNEAKMSRQFETMEEIKKFQEGCDAVNMEFSFGSPSCTDWLIGKIEEEKP